MSAAEPGRVVTTLAPRRGWPFYAAVVWSAYGLVILKSMLLATQASNLRVDLIVNTFTGSLSAMLSVVLATRLARRHQQTGRAPWLAATLGVLGLSATVAIVQAGAYVAAPSILPFARPEPFWRNAFLGWEWVVWPWLIWAAGVLHFCSTALAMEKGRALAEMEEARVRAEHAALRYRLNPEDLATALRGLRARIQVDDLEGAQRQLVALSDGLRLSLSVQEPPSA